MARLDRPLLLALSIVDEARRAAAAQGRMPRTRALRLALADLFARSTGDPAPFATFWRAYAAEYPHLPRPIDAARQRNAELDAAWQAMLRTLHLHADEGLRTALAQVEHWQAQENKALLSAAIREQRRAHEFAKDARECFSPNGHNLPKLMPGAR